MVNGQRFLSPGKFHNHSTIISYTALVIKIKESKMKTIQKVLLGLAVVGSLTVAAADGAAVYKKCTACHGVTGEKKALGKSAVIKGWNAEKIVAALKGYQDGSYGGAMKGLMKGQVASLTDTQIEDVAKFIEAQK